MGRGGLWGAGERLFEAGRLLTFPASKMGACAYSRWALIRVWAFIRINTVSAKLDTNLESVALRTRVN